MSGPRSFGFLVETLVTERLKTLGVWSQFQDAELEFRPASRARSVREQMARALLDLRPHRRYRGPAD